jgi:hypothetical protein
MRLPMRILEFRPLRKNSLMGFAKIEQSNGLQIADVTILAGERGPWASPPSKPMFGSDGMVMKDANGKIRYVPIISFKDRATRDKWSAAIIEALRLSNPEVFGS